jgi:hypothetical protein
VNTHANPFLFKNAYVFIVRQGLMWSGKNEGFQKRGHYEQNHHDKWLISVPIHPFDNYIIWPGSLAFMNREPITLRDLLRPKCMCDVIIKRVYFR